MPPVEGLSPILLQQHLILVSIKTEVIAQISTLARKMSELQPRPHPPSHNKTGHGIDRARLALLCAVVLAIIGLFNLVTLKNSVRLLQERRDILGHRYSMEDGVSAEEQSKEAKAIDEWYFQYTETAIHTYVVVKTVFGSSCLIAACLLLVWRSRQTKRARREELAHYREIKVACKEVP